MRGILLACILALSITGVSWTQPSEAGSTIKRYQAITNTKLPDSTKLRLLLNLAEDPWIRLHADSLAFVKHEIAKILWSLEKGYEGIETDRQTLALRRPYRNVDPENYCRSAFNLASGFRDLNQRDSAIIYFTEVLQTSPVNRQKSLSAFEIGNIYKVNGEFALAKRYGLEALQFGITDSLDEQTQNAFVLLLDNYNIQLHQGDLQAGDSLLRFIAQPRQYFDTFPEPDAYTTRNHALMFWYESHAYKFRHDYAKALDLIAMAQTLLKQSGVRDLQFESELYNSRGILLRRLHQYTEALIALQRSLEMRTADSNEVDIAVTYNNLGDVFLDQQVFDKALQHYHSSVNLVAGNTLGEDVHQLPSADVLAKNGRLLDAFRYVGFKANAWREYCLQSHTPEHCQNALKTYALADSLIDILRAGHLKEGSKLFWREDAKRLYAGAIDAALLAGDDAQALYYADRSKAVLVLDAVREHMIRNTSARQLILQKDSLQEQLTRLEKSGGQNAQWIDLTASLDQINSQLGKVIPSYTDHAQAFSTQRLHDLQQHLQEDEVIVQYFDPPDSPEANHLRDTLYAFVVSRKGFQTFGLNKPAVQEALNAYHETNQAFIKKGITAASESGPDPLHTLLITPLGPLPDHIIIIPDGTISQIGFDGLRDDDGQFLIESKTIHYDLSLAMAQAMAQMSVGDKTRILALAPMTEAICDLHTLPFTQAEIKGISSIAGCKMLLGKEASKTQLLHLATDYGVLHLATHASANTDEPSQSWIALAGDSTTCDLLSVQDLYTQHLPAAMVVVSACEGAYGVYATGEGAMSVARGFAYAGAASVVTSLWQVNDAATAEIMKSFYSYLVKGLTKSDALRQAKLDYIGQEGRKKMELHPAWWSAFVVIGSDSPVTFETPRHSKTIYFVILGIVALAVVIFYRWKRTQTQV